MTIGGKDYLAVNRVKAQEIANQKIDLEACKTNEIRFEDRLKLAEADVTIAQQQTAIEKGNFVRAMALYEKERELRQEAMSFAPVSGTPKGFGGWLLKAVNSPYGAVGFRLVIPAAQFIKTMRQ